MTVTRCGQATHRFALNPTAVGARLDDSRSGLPRENPGKEPREPRLPAPLPDRDRQGWCHSTGAEPPPIAAASV
jgi:hypothetical protein